MFSNGKTFTKKYSIFAINVVYIWETLLLDQHVSVAEWSKAPANHSRDQGGVGSIPSPTKNFFFESNFLFSPRVYFRNYTLRHCIQIKNEIGKSKVHSSVLFFKFFSWRRIYSGPFFYSPFENCWTLNPLYPGILTLVHTRTVNPNRKKKSYSHVIGKTGLILSTFITQ